MIRAIIFDCFGVLVKDSWLPFRQKYFANDPDLFKKATALNQKVDAGQLDYDEFIHRVADMANVPYESAAEQIEDNPANTELFEYISDTLKVNYKLGLLSNAGDNWLGDLFTEQQIALFDAITLSYQVGFIKPDPRIYQAIIDTLNIRASECLFVDDRQACIDGARKAGMQTILYTGFNQFKSSLASVL